MRGSIRKRGEGSWLLQIELERVAGKRHRRFITVRGSRKDAQRELTKLVTAAADGPLPDPTHATVGDYITAYLDNATDLSPKTLERYRELAAVQIIPLLGGIKLQKLRPEDLDPWHATLLATGLSALTCGHTHRVLSKVLNRAVENGTLTRNVAGIRKPPKVEEEEVEKSLLSIRSRPSSRR
jgi:integrase